METMMTMTMTETRSESSALRHPGIIACALHGPRGSLERVMAAIGYAAGLSTPEADLWADSDRLLDAVASALAAALSWLVHEECEDPSPEDWDRVISRVESQPSRVRPGEIDSGVRLRAIILALSAEIRSSDRPTLWTRQRSLEGIEAAVGLIAGWVEELETQSGDLLREEACDCRTQRTGAAIEEAVGDLLVDVATEEADDTVGADVDYDRIVITDCSLFARAAANRAMSSIFQKG